MHTFIDSTFYRVTSFAIASLITLAATLGFLLSESPGPQVDVGAAAQTQSAYLARL